MKKNRSEFAIAARAMAAIVLVVMTTELIVGWLVGVLGIADFTMATVVVSALLLSVLVAPPIYWLVLRPVRAQYEKRQQAEERAEDMTRLAVTDPLTRMMNRRGITVALIDAMAQSERYATPLAVAMADIDHFKQVNDTYGHDAGDRVLVELADVFAAELRMPDKVGRYGGEEFLILLPHTSLAQGRKIADRIRAAVGRRRIEVVDKKKTSVTVSLGIVQFRSGEDLEQLLARVDRAMYEAKESGRNRVVAHKMR